MHKLALVLVIIALLLLAGCTPEPEPAAPASGDPAAGETAWAETTCGGCHGADAASGRAPKLAGTALSQEAFIDIVRQGRGNMPSFGEGQVSDEDLIDIHAWLVSVVE